MSENNLEMAQGYVHPAFPQPEDTSIFLWRYMDLSKFQWLLDWKRLYMPSAEQLGDPFEGTTPAGHLSWWRQLEESAETDEQKEIYRSNQIKLSALAKQFRNFYYVSCWHMNQHENAAI